VKKILAGLALAGLIATPAIAQQAAPAGKADPANTLVIELKSGKVLVKLRPDLAPNHVARVKTLAKEGFYNNVKFHRVLEGFMAQTGDRSGTGTQGSKHGNLKREFTPTPYKRGTVGAARTMDPDTADSQFFICFTDTGCSSLTGQYTVWGEVVSGMELVDKIKRGAPPSGMVQDPDVMVKVYVQADQR
jgi:peptidylprolyl isomerase